MEIEDKNLDSAIFKYYKNLYRFLTDFDNEAPFLEDIKESSFIKKVVLSFKKPDEKRINNRIKSDIKNLEEFLNNQEEIKNIIFHGSYGDYTNINYSDVDITVIINDDVINNYDKLKKLKKNILKKLIPFNFNLAPFQHHGPFILWPSLMKSYDENILPLVAYNCSWAIKEENYSFNVVKNINSKITDFRNKVLVQGEKALETNNLYDYYLFLSNTMLFPTIFLQSLGYYVAKKESFNILENKINKNFTFLSKASNIRNRWSKNNISRVVMKVSGYLSNYRSPFNVSRYCGYFAWNNFNKKEIREIYNLFKIETQQLNNLECKKDVI